jgi:hypothetical protein
MDIVVLVAIFLALVAVCAVCVERAYYQHRRRGGGGGGASKGRR